MPFSYHDLLEKLNSDSNESICRETFSSSIRFKTFEPEDAIELFPELADVKNPNVIYAPVEMCHSLPFVNQRGRCFTHDTLKRSVELVGDNLINFDHEISDNGFTDQERICGHLKGARIGEKNENNEYPMYALATLYRRHPEVKKMANEHTSGNLWYVSMECGHDILKSHFYYEDEFIPVKEAASDMLRCVEEGRIKNYKGKKLSLAVGGKDGVANFWGMALTKTPADEGSNILSMFAASPREVASNSRKNFFFPIKISSSVKNGKNAEELNDNLLREAASIQVIGKTDESAGHSHEVLSDGTILPENNHNHYIKSFVVSPGTKPTFSASLSEYDEYNVTDDYERKLRSSHSHKLLIDLKPKKTKKSEGNVNGNDDSILRDYGSIVNNKQEGEEMSKFLDQLRASVSQISEIANALKPKEEDEDKVKTALKLVKEIEELDLDKAIANAVAEEIDEKIEGGEFVKKEDHEKMLEEAREEVKNKINLENEKEKMKSKRIEDVKGAGIDLEFVVEEDGDEKVTIQDMINSIPLDEDGEKFFKRNLSIWKKLSGVNEENSENNNGNNNENNNELKEAASKKTPIMKIAGGGQTKNKNKNGKEKDKKKFGKHALTTV